MARGIITTNYKHFSPRIGFAWDPFGDRKTAIRGAAGIFYGSISGNEWNTSSDNQPFAIRQQFNDVYSLSDPYKLQPGGVGPFPYSYSPAAPRFVAPSAIVGISLDYKLPYTYQMNFAIQREITRTTSLTVAYVSNLTHRIPAIQDVNYPVLTSTATTANVNARRPYLPGTLSSIGMISSILNSAYHGLQVKGDRRFANHFTLRGLLHLRQGAGRGQHPEQHPAAGHRLEQYQAGSRPRQQRPHAQRRHLRRLGFELLFADAPPGAPDRRRLVAGRRLPASAAARR